MDPARHILVLALITTAAGVVMMRLGLFHNMLESRRGVRLVPYCESRGHAARHKHYA